MQSLFIVITMDANLIENACLGVDMSLKRFKNHKVQQLYLIAVQRAPWEKTIEDKQLYHSFGKNGVCDCNGVSYGWL